MPFITLWLRKVKSFFGSRQNTVQNRANDYLQSPQYILNRCFVNNTLRLKQGGLYSSQDYLNAVFDKVNDSLKVSIDGADGILYWGEPVATPANLPSSAREGEVRMVKDDGTGTNGLYYYETGAWHEFVMGGGETASSVANDSVVSGENVKEALDWIKTNKISVRSFQIKSIGVAGSGADYECDGTDDQVQFAQAISDASAGSTIRILAGIYNFSAKLTINKALFFEGIDRTLSIINIIGSFTGIDVTAPGCIFRYINVMNSNATGVTDGSKSLMHLKADNQVIDSCAFYWASPYSTGIFSNCRFHEFKRNTIVAYFGLYISWTDTVAYVGLPPQSIIIDSNIFGDYALGVYCHKGIYMNNAQGNDYIIQRNRILASGYAIEVYDGNARAFSIYANSFSCAYGSIFFTGSTNININANLWMGAPYVPIANIVLENVAMVNIDSNNFNAVTTDFIQLKGTTSGVNITDNIGSGIPTGGITESGASNYTTVLGNVNIGVVTLIGANSKNRDRYFYTISASAKNYNSDGIEGDLSYNGGYLYRCIVTGTGGSGRWVRSTVETSF